MSSEVCNTEETNGGINREMCEGGASSSTTSKTSTSTTPDRTSATLDRTKTSRQRSIIRSVYGRIQGRKSSVSEEPTNVTPNPMVQKLSQSAKETRSEVEAIQSVRKTSLTCLQEHEKKVAVKGAGPNLATLFYVFNQHRPLAAILADICDKWTLASPEDFALKFSESSRQSYITEHNRAEIQNGNVLELTGSPAKSAQNIIEKLRDGSREERLDALKSLMSLAADITFAQEFINRKGLQIIIDFVVSGNKYTGEPLMYILKSFVALMDHNVVSWDILEPEFTKQVVDCLSGSSSRNSVCLQPALEILECVILHSSNYSKHVAVEQNLTPEKVLEYLKSQQHDVQKSSLALINAMFLKATDDKKKKIAESLHSRAFRNLITNIVLESSHSVGQEMAHQLYVLQTLMLNLYEERLNKGVNPNDTSTITLVNKHIEELRRMAFDFSDVSDPNSTIHRRSTVSKDYKKLGFSNQMNPALEFEKCPPGLLALDNMIYFAQVHKESYIRVVLENSRDENDCPFAQASVKLTGILCNLLRIGESPDEVEQSFYPMFFAVDKPLEEFFSICIQTLNRTWRDMRASREDFPKVLSVVKEQISRALERSTMPKNFQEFKTKLSQLTFSDIKKIWDAERQQKDETEAQARPIQELKKALTPSILTLIQQHRLNYMENGTKFPKYDSKGGRAKNRYHFWRLSPNHKALHYGDCTDSQSYLSLEQLQNKVPICEIRQIVTGSKCPHYKSKKNHSENVAFAIHVEESRPDESDAVAVHCFLANTEYEFCVWTDGLNTLLNNSMDSFQTKKDMDMLLNMEIKLHLLETEGITIPKEAPPIPALPDNFNFVYPTA